MPLFGKVYDTDLDEHLGRGRIKALYARYQKAWCAARAVQSPRPRPPAIALPQLNALCIDQCMGLENWASRLIQLPDGDFLYTFYGSQVSQAVGFTMTGKRVSNGSGQAFSFFSNCYTKAAKERQPLVTFSSALASPSVASWRRLILPCVDEGDFMHILTILEPIAANERMMDAIMEAVDEPVIALHLLRDQGQEVLDARLISANQPALDAMGKTSTRHLNLSDFAPQLLDEPVLSTLRTAYSDGKKSRYEGEILLGRQAFNGLVATPLGDGVALVFGR